MNEAAKRLQAAIEEKRHSDKYAVTVLVNQPDIKAVLDESTTQAARIAELEALVAKGILRINEVVEMSPGMSEAKRYKANLFIAEAKRLGVTS